MADWKRIIVGDAFALPSRDLNYYRDVVLFWPFLLFTAAAVANLFRDSHGFGATLTFASLSLLFVLLAREKVVLIIGALGFSTVQSFAYFILRRSWVGLAVALCAGSAFVVLLRLRGKHKASYGFPRETMVAVLVSLVSLGLTILLFRWIGR